MKALHPSDPMTEVRGIPDRSAVPSLLMNYQAILNVNCHAGSVGTWDFDATLLPHPVDFLVVDYRDSVAPAGTYTNLLNPQIDGATHQAKYEAFSRLAQRWRLAYMSVTAIQNGSSMVNQGEIACAQVPVAPTKLYSAGFNNGGYASTMMLNRVIEKYSAEDLPVFGTLQSMPNAYLNKSKEGAYMPLKLTDTCQTWMSDADACGVLQETLSADPGGKFLVGNATVPAWPHESLTPSTATFDPADPKTSWGLNSLPTSPMLNGVFGHICGKGIDVATSFTFLVRCGIEMQVTQTSTLAPQLKISPPYDPIALDTYFAISRMLKDAYPESYNSGGKLWDVVKQVGRVVAPFLGGIFGGPAGAVAASGLTEGVASLGDAFRNRRKAYKQFQKSQASPAAMSVSALASSPSVNTMAATELVKAAVANAAPRRRYKVPQKRPRNQPEQVVILPAKGGKQSRVVRL